MRMTISKLSRSDALRDQVDKKDSDSLDSITESVLSRSKDLNSDDGKSLIDLRQKISSLDSELAKAKDAAQLNLADIVDDYRKVIFESRIHDRTRNKAIQELAGLLKDSGIDTRGISTRNLKKTEATLRAVSANLIKDSKYISQSKVRRQTDLANYTRSDRSLLDMTKSGGRYVRDIIRENPGRISLGDMRQQGVAVGLRSLGLGGLDSVFNLTGKVDGLLTKTTDIVVNKLKSVDLKSKKTDRTTAQDRKDKITKDDFEESQSKVVSSVDKGSQSTSKAIDESTDQLESKLEEIADGQEKFLTSQQSLLRQNEKYSQETVDAINRVAMRPVKLDAGKLGNGGGGFLSNVLGDMLGGMLAGRIFGRRGLLGRAGRIGRVARAGRLGALGGTLGRVGRVTGGIGRVGATALGALGLGGIAARVGGLAGRSGAVAGGIGGRVGLGAAARVGARGLAAGSRFIPGIGLITTAGFALLGAARGLSKKETERLFGKDTFMNRIKSMGANLLSELTFGLVPPEKIVKAGKWIADKQKQFYSLMLAPLKAGVEFVSKGFGKMFDWLKTLPVVGKFFTGLGVAATAVGSAVGGAASSARSVASNVGDSVRNTASRAGIGNGRRLSDAEANRLVSSGLGSVSARFESGNKGVSTISSGRGDHGGASYGKHQLSSRAGTLQRYLRDSGYASQFQGMSPGSTEFNNKWRQLAANDPEFGRSQETFMTQTHYAPMANRLKSQGYDLSSRGRGVQEMIYSVATQYGPGATSKITRALQGKDLASMSDEQIIRAVQDAKMANVDSDFRSSSQNVRAGVRNRIGQELEALLAVQSQTSPASTPGSTAPASSTPGTQPASPREAATRAGQSADQSNVRALEARTSSMNASKSVMERDARRARAAAANLRANPNSRQAQREAREATEAVNASTRRFHDEKTKLNELTATVRNRTMARHGPQESQTNPSLLTSPEPVSTPGSVSNPVETTASSISSPGPDTNTNTNISASVTEVPDTNLVSPVPVSASSESSSVSANLGVVQNASLGSMTISAGVVYLSGNISNDSSSGGKESQESEILDPVVENVISPIESRIPLVSEIINQVANREVLPIDTRIPSVESPVEILDSSSNQVLSPIDARIPSTVDSPVEILDTSSNQVLSPINTRIPSIVDSSVEVMDPVSEKEVLSIDTRIPNIQSSKASSKVANIDKSAYSTVKAEGLAGKSKVETSSVKSEASIKNAPARLDIPYIKPVSETKQTTAQQSPSAMPAPPYKPTNYSSSPDTGDRRNSVDDIGLAMIQTFLNKLY